MKTSAVILYLIRWPFAFALMATLFVPMLVASIMVADLDPLVEWWEYVGEALLFRNAP